MVSSQVDSDFVLHHGYVSRIIILAKFNYKNNSGIPFLFDIISSAVEYENGRDKTFYERLCLDIMNLFSVSFKNLVQILNKFLFVFFQGVFIFLVICCKSKMVKKVRTHLSPTRQSSYITQQTQVCNHDF